MKRIYKTQAGSGCRRSETARRNRSGLIYRLAIRGLLICVFCLLIVVPLAVAQTGGEAENSKKGAPGSVIKYYRVDNVKSVTGDIAKIASEKTYDRSDFVVAYVTEAGTGKQYKVEISPDWFFRLELMKGNRIEITGALNRVNEQDIIMTRFLVFQGKEYHFRDENGFPLWRGQGRNSKGSGRGYGRGRGRGQARGGQNRHRGGRK